MSIPAIEDFSGASGALAGSWTQQQTSVGTVNKNGAGKGVASTATSDVFAYRNERTYSPNQYSQARITSGLAINTQFLELQVRASGLNGTALDYEFFTDGTSGTNHSAIAKRVANVTTEIAFFAITFASGDLVRFIAQDVGVDKVLLTVLKNGVSIGTFIDTTSPILTGNPGVGLSGTTVLIDDWEGWDLPIIGTGKPYIGNNDIGFLLEDYNGMFILSE